MAKRKRMSDAEELNLIPIMNLVTILIPFLLLSVQFISLAIIDSTLPAIGPPAEPTEEQDEDPPLNLSVMITDQGFTVRGATSVLPDAETEEGPTIPCVETGCPTPKAYDTKALTRLLAQIKDEHRDEENVILVPESRIPYEVIVMAMDATRNDPSQIVEDKPRELFPYVVIAGGVK